MTRKTTVAVGKADRRAVTVVVARCAAPPAPPIHGPWTLKAVVSAN